MERFRAFGLALIWAGVLSLSLSGPLFGGDRRIRVVATLPNLGHIASTLAGDQLELTVVAAGTQDAHYVDAKPSFLVKLRKADLLLVNGLDLEIGWVPSLTQGARNARVLPGAAGYIDCSAGIEVVDVPRVLSRAEGDVHPYGNPHYLTDPLNAEIVAGTVTAALSRADPDRAALYEKRQNAFVEKLHRALFGSELVELAGGAKLARMARAGQLDSFLDGTAMGSYPLRSRLGGWMGKLSPFTTRPVITYHRDFTYFAQRFGLKVVDYIEPKPGIPPSPRHLKQIRERIQSGEAQIIITRPFVEHRSTDFLAEQTGARVITLPLEVGGAEGVDDYFALFDYVTDRLIEAL